MKILITELEDGVGDVAVEIVCFFSSFVTSLC